MFNSKKEDRLTIRVSKELKDSLEAQAIEDKRSFADYVRLILWGSIKK